MEIANFNDVGELIKTIREKHSLSKLELAERINTNGSYLSILESGKKVPGRNILKRISDAFSIDLEECMQLRTTKDQKENDIKTKTDKDNSNKDTKKEKNIIDLEERKNRQKVKGTIVIEDYKTIAALFKAVRKTNNLTNSMMGKEMGLSNSYLSQIENGKKYPSRKMVVKLAETFKLPLEKCLEIASFETKQSVEAVKETKSSSENKSKKKQVDQETKNINVEVLVPVNSKESIVEAKEDMVESEETTSVQVENPVEVESEIDGVSHLQNKTISISAYDMIAQAKMDLSDKAEYEIDLKLIMENMHQYRYEYELMNVDGSKQAVLLSIENNKMRVKLKA